MSLSSHINEKANLIWAIADKLTGVYKPHEYGEVILPLTVIRRFDCILADTKEAVLKKYEEVKELPMRDILLRNASGYQFYNTSRFTFEKLLDDPDNIEANFRDYLNGFSPNVTEIIEKFKFDGHITTMAQKNILYIVLKEFTTPQANLHPDHISNLEMGYIFEEIIRRFSEAHNEDVVGKALAPVRDEVVIATKFGVTHAPDKTILVDSRPEVIRISVEKSLRRLRTDHIDLYYQHRIDPKVEPEVVAGTMADLIKEGKIRAWGISEATEEYLRRADAVCPVSAVQNRYSMMARWNESLFPVLEELNVALVAFSPMANGFLTGAYSHNTRFEGAQDYRDGMPQYTEEGERRAEPLMRFVRELAELHAATPAQVSLSWMLEKKPYIIPIPGSRKPERLLENLGAAEVGLTDDEVAKVDELLNGLDLMVFGGHAVR